MAVQLASSKKIQDRKNRITEIEIYGDLTVFDKEEELMNWMDGGMNRICNERIQPKKWHHNFNDIRGYFIWTNGWFDFLIALNIWSSKMYCANQSVLPVQKAS